MITIYSTPVCKYCNDAKAFFKKHNLEYKEINVAEDQEARAYIMELTGRTSVPVIIIGDQAVVGFDEALLTKLTEVG